jgi:hypothetical protein
LQRFNPGVQQQLTVNHHPIVPSTHTTQSKKSRGPMADLSLEKVLCLLGVQHIKGSGKELKMLCIRINELVELNGEDWVKESRQSLLDEWEYIVSQEIIGGSGGNIK